MKNYAQTFITLLKELVLHDLVGRYLFWISVVLGLADYLVWHFLLSSPDVYVYIRIAIYPVHYLALVLIINTFLAISAFEKEKEISYLFLIGNVIVSVLILIMEFFYLFAQ